MGTDENDRSVRQIRDAKVLSALAQPVRGRLMDALAVYGPSTASLLSERTGEAVGNVSHHLKVLATAGLIEQAPELARDRRERWWRRASDVFRWQESDFADDDRDSMVQAAATSMTLEHHTALARAWQQGRAGDSDAWPTGPFMTGRWLRLTDGQLAALGAEMLDLLDRHERHPITDDASPVFVYALGFPARP